MKKKNSYIWVIVICVVLTTAITVQVRTMKGEGSVVSIGYANSQLRDSLLEWKERAERAEHDLEKSITELEKTRMATTNNDNSSEEKQKELKEYNKLLGLTDVSGSGITITVSDSNTEATSLDLSALIIHDTDLRGLVNELSNAGAEAISINGERIVSSTCITCAGNVIQINGNKVGSPFVIKAIGSSESLYGAITRAGGYTSALKARSIQVDSKKSNNIQINKFTGALTQKYINTVE